MSKGGAERDGDTESESEAGSRLRAVSTEPDVGLEPTNHEIMTQAKVGTQLTEPPRPPSLVLPLFQISMRCGHGVGRVV